MKKRLNRLVIICAVLLLVFACSVCAVSAVSVNNATGKVNSSDGAFIREKASTESAAIYCADDNAKLTILKEVFVDKKSTKKTSRWYQVTIKDKTGYIRYDLVDTVTYKSLKGKTTDEVNYRKGPGTGFTSAGIIRKGKSVTVVLKANVKGSGTWYKIKKNSKYYYIKKDYIKLTSSSGSGSGSGSSSSKTTKVTVSVSGESLPSTVGKGSSFPLKGEVTANKTIDKAKFGITNSKGAWITYKEVSVGSKTFNIATIDEFVKFGELATGTYKYVGNVYIGKKGYQVIDKSFKVVKLNGPDLIKATALQFAWAAGTPESVYSTEPDSDYESAATLLGYKGRLDDCSMFVKTVLVYSGYDKSYPGDITKQWTYLAESPKWTKVVTANENFALESELQPGDVIIYRRNNGNWHTNIYVGKINGTSYVAEASRTKELYGFLNPKISKVTNDDKMQFAAYRAAS